MEYRRVEIIFVKDLGEGEDNRSKKVFEDRESDGSLKIAGLHDTLDNEWACGGGG